MTPIRVLLVEDSEDDAELVLRVLRHDGFEPTSARVDTEEGMAAALDAHEWDIVISDYRMPQFNGLAALELVRSRGLDVPFIIVSGTIGEETAVAAMRAGADDYLMKANLARLGPAVERELAEAEQRRTYRLTREQNRTLEQMVRTRTRALEETQADVLIRLARAAEFRDDATGRHTERVGATARLVAQALGLSERQVTLIGLAAPLHDVGKIAIPDSILLKPGKLSGEEFERMKTHAMIGARILGGGRFPLLQLAERIALTHHERWDGRGYPQGLRGNAIPLAGQIVAIADVFDALIHDRPYKRAWPVAQALAELDRQRGRQFAPRVVEAFMRVRGQVPAAEGDE